MKLDAVLAARRRESIRRSCCGSGDRTLSPLESGAQARSFMEIVTQRLGAGLPSPLIASPWVVLAFYHWKKLAGVPVVAEIMEADGSKVAASSAFVDLINKPTMRLDRVAYFETLLLSLLHYGAYFVQKRGLLEATDSGTPKTLHPLPAGNMRPKEFDGAGRVTVWEEWRSDGKSVLHPYETLIVYGELPSPYAKGRFISRLDALALSVSSDYHGRRHNEGLVRRSGRVDSIWSYEDAGQEELQLYKEMADKMFLGSGNAGSTIHVNGVQDIKTLGMNQKDLDWTSAMGLSREEILGTLQVPIELVGLGNTTFANKEQAKRDLWEEFLVPLGELALLSPHIQALDVDPRLSFRFTFDESVPALGENRSKKVDDFATLRLSGVSIRQAAKLVGLPIEEEEGLEEDNQDGETSKSADPSDPSSVFAAVRSFVEEKIAPIDLDGGDPPPASQEPAGSDKPGDGGEDPDEIERRRLGLWRAAVDPIEKQEAKATKKLAGFFFRQRREVLKAWEELKASTYLANLEEKVGSKDFAGETRAIDPTPEELAFADSIFDAKAWDPAIVSTISGFVVPAFKDGAQQIIEQAGKGALPVGAAELYTQQSAELYAKVNQTTRAKLAATHRTIVRGLEEGLPVDEVSALVEKDLRGVFNDARNNRSKTIARTELGRGLNGGRDTMMDELGVELVEWITSRDSVVRDTHQDLDGRRVRRGSSFKPGMTLRYPLDPSAPAGETVNCRCVLVPVLPPEIDNA